MPPKIGELTLLKTLSAFTVSQGKNGQLGELQFLDLGGDLWIQHLERVLDQVDAKKASLNQKPNLRDLSFTWETDHSSQSQNFMDEKVLEALEPHPNIKKLFLRGFRGKDFPMWMRSYSTLENLFKLCIWDCPNCSSLPQMLEELPHLEELYLRNLGVVYIIEDEVQGFNLMKPKFPSLRMLNMFDLPHVKGLLKDETGVAFPNLQDLTARDCPSFSLPQLSSIRYLYCNSMMLTSFYKLDNLTTLWVIFDDNMTPVQKEALQNLINLNSLTILRGNEHSLPEEGLQGVKSLTSLDIRSFNTLTCIPESWLSNLTALEFLRLYGLSELVEIPEGIKCLHNLTSLSLIILPKMECLPKTLQYLTSLQTLFLFRLTQLASLPDWLENLTSLASIDIRECPRLLSFPVSIRKMGKLRRLKIIECPELWRRCEKGRGEDWHKISHIPYVSNKIDY